MSPVDRQNIIGSCIFIQSDSLCFLIELFSSFTTNATIAMDRFRVCH